MTLHDLLRRLRLALQADDLPTALDCLIELVTQAEERQDGGAAARHLGNLALLYYRMGHPDLAVETFQRGLSWARQTQDLHTENGLLGNLGNVLRELKRYEEALKALHGALLLAQMLGDARGRGLWLSNLGLLYGELGQHEQARDAHQQALKIAQQLHDLPQQAARTHYLALAALALGHQDAAFLMQQAADLYTQLGQTQQAERLEGEVQRLTYKE